MAGRHQVSFKIYLTFCKGGIDVVKQARYDVSAIWWETAAKRFLERQKKSPCSLHSPFNAKVKQEGSIIRVLGFT